MASATPIDDIRAAIAHIDELYLLPGTVADKLYAVRAHLTETAGLLTPPQTAIVDQAFVDLTAYEASPALQDTLLTENSLVLQTEDGFDLKSEQGDLRLFAIQTNLGTIV